jgi:hypothetical protein
LKKAALAALAIVVVAAVVQVWRGRTTEQPPETRQPDTSTERPPESRVPPFSPAFVQQMRGLLREAGVEIFSDESIFERGDAEPKAFAVSEFQLRNMAVEASGDTNGGVYGFELDAIAPLPEGAPPLSFFIAAWVSRGATPAAKSAAALMGDRDWSAARGIVYPTVVLAAFVGDAVRATSEETRTARARLKRFYNYLGNVFVPGAEVFAQTTGGNACTVISSFFQNVMTTVFDALKIKTQSGGVVGFFADLWNGAVQLAKTVIGGLLTILTDAVVDKLQGAVALVSVVATISSVVRPWSLRVQPDPNSIRYAVGKEPAPTGTVTARIDNNGFPGWPAGLEKCASDFGVKLPTADAEVGVPVSWNAPSALTQQHIEGTYRDLKLPASKEPRLEYVVKGRETAEDAKFGKETTAEYRIEVSFERAAVTKLKELLVTLITNTIPGFAGSVVKPVVAYLTASALAAILEATDARGAGILAIRYHSVVRCPLFTLAQANQTLHQQFSVVAPLDDGCAAGTPGGGSVAYSYIDLTCKQLAATLVTVGITPLPLGPGAFYRKLSDRHVVTFPSVKRPSHCIQLHLSPAIGTDVKDVIKLAQMMRPDS